jgi:hypothetical protein
MVHGFIFKLAELVSALHLTGQPTTNMQ